MGERGRRTLTALAAGASVPAVLFLLTLFSSDRPLLGIDPDLLIVLGAVLATLIGSVVYAGLEGARAKPWAIGAGLGIVGFIVLFGIVMSLVAALNQGAAYYGGWEVTTGFDETWNHTRAAGALQAQGFNVTRAGSDGLYAVKTENATSDEVRVLIDADPPIRGRPASNATFGLQVEFRHDGEALDNAREARAQADAAKPAIETRFEAFLAAFEEDTDWTHVGDPTWEPGIAMT